MTFYSFIIEIAQQREYIYRDFSSWNKLLPNKASFTAVSKYLGFLTSQKNREKISS